MARKFNTRVAVPGFSYAGFEQASDAFNRVADRLKEYDEQSQEVTLSNFQAKRDRNTQDLISRVMQEATTADEVGPALSRLRDQMDGPVQEADLNTFFTEHTERLRSNELENAKLALEEDQLNLQRQNVQSQAAMRNLQRQQLEGNLAAGKKAQEAMGYLTDLSRRYNEGKNYATEGQYKDYLSYKAGDVEFNDNAKQIFAAAENPAVSSASELDMAILRSKQEKGLPLSKEQELLVQEMAAVQESNANVQNLAQQLRAEAERLQFSDEDKFNASPAGQNRYLVDAILGSGGNPTVINSLLGGGGVFDATGEFVSTPEQTLRRERQTAKAERQAELSDFRTKEQIKAEFKRRSSGSKSKKGQDDIIEVIDKRLSDARNMPDWDAGYESALIEFYARPRAELKEEFNLPDLPTDEQVDQFVDYILQQSSEDERTPFLLPRLFFNSEFHPDATDDNMRVFRNIVLADSESILRSAADDTLSELQNITPQKRIGRKRN